MYNLTKEEKSFLETFKKTRIPFIFRDDYIEHMLFIELLDFDICSFLLKDKEITTNLYSEAMNGYSYFMDDVDTKKLDKDALIYYEMCKDVIRILKEKQINER